MWDWLGWGTLVRRTPGLGHCLKCFCAVFVDAHPFCIQPALRGIFSWGAWGGTKIAAMTSLSLKTGARKEGFRKGRHQSGQDERPKGPAFAGPGVGWERREGGVREMKATHAHEHRVNIFL